MIETGTEAYKNVGRHAALGLLALVGDGIV
jgi:hypothetical protein